jgi:predicted membrane chloride channel (bestrophin family)
MGTAFYDTTDVSPEKREEDLQRLSSCTWAFVRSMKRHLSPEWEDEEFFKTELHERLPKGQADAVINAAHRPNRALYDLSLAIENLPMHYLRKNQLHLSLTQFEDNLGSSERLLTSPVPLFYSRHLGRFLSLWVFLLPLGLYGQFGDTWNNVGLIPATTLLSLFLFGIEELAAQMEEPFTILPMQAFCDKIGNWCNEIVSWKPGDNGMPIKGQPALQHTTDDFEEAAPKGYGKYRSIAFK